MTHKKPTDFVLGEMHADIKTIKEQTIKTNGRVSDLERRQTVIEKWKESLNGKFIGAVAVISIIYTFLSPIAQNLLSSLF